MISIDIRHDLGALAERLGLLAKERQAAAVSALNKTLTTVRARAARDLARDYAGLKVGVLKKQLRFRRATRSEARAVLTFGNRRFRLINWRVRQSPGGVRGRLPWALETGDGQPIPAAQLRHAFIQRATTNGVENVFLRAGRARYPLHVLLAPSLSYTVVQKRLNTALSRFARERFAVVFQQDAKFRLSKR